MFLFVKDSPNRPKKEEALNANFEKSLDINSSNYDSSPSGMSQSPTFSGSQSSTNNAATGSANNHTSSFLPTVTIKTTFNKTKSIQPINQAFAEEEDDQATQAKRARLPGSSSGSLGTPHSSSQQHAAAEERKRAVKKLVESIPTDRDELFAYKIDWDQLDAQLMEKRIKPWINKKIIEYIGEEEPSVTDFICTNIQSRTRAERLLDDVKVILDDEAELFIKKMWRLIVYETESKRCGLSK